MSASGASESETSAGIWLQGSVRRGCALSKDPNGCFSRNVHAQHRHCDKVGGIESVPPFFMIAAAGEPFEHATGVSTLVRPPK